MNLALLKKDQDFEWYPTTDEILLTVYLNVKHEFNDDAGISIMDIGAGDGRVLTAFKGCDWFAIEKSEPLLAEMDKNIVIVGTDFHHTTLIDKKVDVIFCNPPYSEYVDWMSKIIREANAHYVYMVVPRRWKEQPLIHEATRKRKADYKIIGTFDFLSGDRQSRVVVNIVKITLNKYDHYRYRRSVNVDPFDLWFDENFPIKDRDDSGPYKSERDKLNERLSKELVTRRNLVVALVSLYNNEMQMLLDNFKAVSRLNADVLRELSISKDGLKTALREKIKNLKTLYWQELLSKLHRITSRLTSSTRRKMIDRFSAHTSVEFNEKNIYAVVLWCIKNANVYYDEQVIEVVGDIVSKSNIKLYKSNHRTYQNDDWYYLRRDKKFKKYYLDLRIIVNAFGAITSDTWDAVNGLQQGAATIIDDLVTVANTFGMACQQRCNYFDWVSGRKNTFYMTNGDPLMEVKAFKNGNLHIKFNQDFIKKLNVEFGRLKGWIKTPEDANNEMNMRDASRHFKSIKKISHNYLLEWANEND